MCPAIAAFSQHAYGKLVAVGLVQLRGTPEARCVYGTHTVGETRFYDESAAKSNGGKPLSSDVMKFGVAALRQEGHVHRTVMSAWPPLRQEGHVEIAAPEHPW